MTTAGNGARQQQEAARRRVEEAERQLAAARAREHAWATGAAGEEQVAEALGGLDRLGWVVFHDVPWPGRQRANLDHVLVGPGGVVLVDTKNWTGTVTVDPVRGLRSGGYGKTKETDAVQTALQALVPLVPEAARGAASGVVCLAAQDQEPVRVAGGTVVVGRAQLRELVLSLPAVLTPQLVVEASVALGEALRRPPAEAGARPTRPAPGAGSPGPRGRRKKGLRGDLVRLGVLAVVVGALWLFPEQVTRTYLSVVDAVVAPIGADLVENIQDAQQTAEPVTPAP